MTDKEDPVESGAIGVSDVFKDEEPEPVEAKAEAEPEPESKGEEAEPEAEVEATTETEATEEPTAEPPSAEPASVPKQALLDERRKRQALEDELKILRKAAPKDEQAPDPLDDPEGYKNYLRSQWENERITEATNKSRERMLETTPDYEEMEKHFTMLAMADPSLVQQLKTHHDPAKFAYDYAKESKGKTFAEIEKQVIEKLRKEGKLKEKPSAPEVATLINSPGAGKNSEKPVKEITTIGEIFAR